MDGGVRRPGVVLSSKPITSWRAEGSASMLGTADVGAGMRSGGGVIDMRDAGPRARSSDGMETAATRPRTSTTATRTVSTDQNLLFTARPHSGRILPRPLTRKNFSRAPMEASLLGGRRIIRTKNPAHPLQGDASAVR